MQYVCSKCQGNKIYSLFFLMATLSHCKLFLQLCLVIACVCFCLLWFCCVFFFFGNLSTDFHFGCLMFPVFFGLIFSPGVALHLSRRKIQSCGPALLQEAHAFPAAVGPALQAESILCVCADLSCILTCRASVCGILSTLGGFECWMQLMSYLHTWLCDVS